MNYIELEIAEPNEQNQEILIATLSDWPFESFSQSEDGVKAYILETNFNKQIFEDIKAALPKVEIEKKSIQQQNWNAAWESNFQPINIEDRIYVRAEFHPSIEGIETELIITPKMSFGTGHHQTTYLMLKQLLALPLANKTVLDMGCGTGILGFYCLKHNAKELVAIDNDEWAYSNAVENAKLNGLEATILHGGKESIPEMKFDLIIANINKLILLDQISTYAKHLQSGGTLLLSGFYKNDVDDLEQEAAKYGLHFVAFDSKDEWTMMRLES